MPDADGRIRGISVGNVPWHNGTADATLGSLPDATPPEPEETLDFMDDVQELAAVLVGRNVTRVYREDGWPVIETGDTKIWIHGRAESPTFLFEELGGE